MKRLLALLTVFGLMVASVIGASHASQAQAAPPKWHSVFSGNFDSGFSSKIWTRYNGVPTCCSTTRWSRSHLVAKGGVMQLQDYRESGRWVSAGMSMGRSLNQTYGKWSVRFRMDRGMGVGMCIALWPKSGWPPEIDFAEESSQYGNRHVQTGTLHYGPHNSQNHAQVTSDFSKWHVMSVEWTPRKLVYLIDGRRWHTITGSIVPHQPMHLIIQTHVGSNGQSGGMPSTALKGHVDLHIDWVHVFRFNG